MAGGAEWKLQFVCVFTCWRCPPAGESGGGPPQSKTLRAPQSRPLIAKRFGLRWLAGNGADTAFDSSDTVLDIQI